MISLGCPTSLESKGDGRHLWGQRGREFHRRAIWDIQIGKYGRDAKQFDTVQLAKVTEGLTGSEIKNAFVEALYAAFDAGKEPTELDIASVLTEFVPLSNLMAEQITVLKNWAKGRARLATSLEQERRGLREIGV